MTGALHVGTIKEICDESTGYESVWSLHLVEMSFELSDTDNEITHWTKER